MAQSPARRFGGIKAHARVPRGMRRSKTSSRAALLRKGRGRGRRTRGARDW
ncbi:hypothetical protein I79_016486 [Cricetulus griseus]|uniref:Uncharacterized protein n=1 Tax=Cricetulus griseus TaxID=10029 RepID=G3HZI2_CRIGR|nr:hypothetical protein I79_016486 [Cricetulus griseus]